MVVGGRWLSRSNYIIRATPLKRACHLNPGGGPWKGMNGSNCHPGLHIIADRREGGGFWEGGIRSSQNHLVPARLDEGKNPPVFLKVHIKDVR